MEEIKAVRIWEETVIIPTYKVYPPEKNPMFMEKRAYQGSTGKVYPLPVTEKISDKKEDVSYRAVFLENEYLKVMILPELGGRIQRAYDKTNGYDFVYYNHVMKPALVGLTGPWVSGGIEFNWPQHHRPSTYSPVDYKISENADGSCTVFVGEIDKMYGTKGMAAISLYPGKAYIEIKGQLYNHTDLPQTFLWWANPAVPVNDYTYSVFPPDVNAVMDHGKRAVSTFPIATGEYYKCDYSAGVDISRYKNVKVPTSYMAAHSDFDFIGNYDEKLEAGLLHVADHHISPGKKQWTWGNGDFGRTWDRNLTETDGPYIELMTGVFCDNQPDFTWLKPGEEKTFVQYFMPYKGVGHVGNATKEAALSLMQNDDGTVTAKVYATADYKNAVIELSEKDENGQYKLVGTTAADLSPTTCYSAAFTPKKLQNCKVSVLHDGKVLAEYKVYEKKLEEIPSPAEYMKQPQDMKSLEELYLAATHLEQYRHATFEPADYYLEGLKRDATDIRLNNGYGLLLYKRGRAAESIPYFKAAIKKQTWKNPNPYSGECYFNLGLALEAVGRDDEAYDAFFKATWSAETQSAGFYWLASLAARKNNFESALEFAEKSMLRSWHNMKSRALKAAMLRKLGKDTSALLNESIAIDPLYMGTLYENALAQGTSEAFAAWVKMMRSEAHNYLELSLDYSKAGLYEDAIRILSACADGNPLLHYYQGYAYTKLGETEAAKATFVSGENANADYCFPNRVEEIRILEMAIHSLDAAPMACLYLGNLYYDKKQYAIAASYWQQAAKQKPTLAMAHRNLAIYYFNKQHDNTKALEKMCAACTLDPAYPRNWLEYDQLAAKLPIPTAERLATMQQHMEQVTARDDLYLRYITMLNCAGRCEEALVALRNRLFHPWEGGEGKVVAQYRFALISLAKRDLENGKPQDAFEKLEATLTYPENLGEGKLPNVPDNEAYYYMGLACRAMGKEDLAQKYLHLATLGDTEPQKVLYYNDQPSDYIFYQGKASAALGNDALAKKAFHQLTIFGETHLFDHAAPDFFAVSMPEIEVFQDDIQMRNTVYCNYLRGLGAIGLGEKEKAAELLKGILADQPDYQGAMLHLEMIK